MKTENQTRITGEVHFEDVVSRNVLERNDIQALSVSDTPSVLNQKFFEAKSVSPITVTDFKNGSPAQRLYILGDGNTTVEHGTFIFTNTGADKLLELNKVYKFTYFPINTSPKSHKWVEDA